jgi:hypothetical protein
MLGSEVMLILNVLETFAFELKSFIIDVKNVLLDIFSNIYNFLNSFLPKEAIFIFIITLVVFITLYIFTRINK